jgi:NitT/TauT family transport system permease protein
MSQTTPLGRGEGGFEARQGFRVNPFVISAAVLPLLFGFWYLISYYTLIPWILLPSPQQVWEAIPEVLTARGFSKHVVRTLSEIVFGFVAGTSIGMFLGLLLGSSQKLRKAYLPALSALQSVPKIVLAPLIIAWVGFGISGKIIQAAIACFYAVFVTTLAGLELADTESIRLMYSLRASKVQIMRRVRIPCALPAIFGGLQLGATMAIIGGIVSEFVAADAGLGFLMIRYRSSFRVAEAWVLIFVFLILGLVSYMLLQLAERKVVFWRRHAATDSEMVGGP